MSEEKNVTNKRLSIVVMIMAALVLLASVALILVNYTVRNKYKGERWYENEVSIDTTVEEQEAFENVNDNVSSIATEWVYGRKGAYNRIVEDDEYYYIVNPADNYNIYKISKDGNFENTLIIDTTGSYINVVDDKLYFANNYDDTEYAKGIYSVNTDGSNLEMLTDGSAYYMQIVNDWCYYVDGNNNNLYKLNLFTRRPILLSDKYITDFSVVENTIYYAIYDEDAEDFAYTINSMDVDGKNMKVISDPCTFSYMYYDNDDIYVLTSREGIYRMSTTTFEFEFLCGGALISPLCSNSEYIYSIDESLDRRVAVYKISDGSLKYYNTDKVSNVYVTDDIIVTYYNVDGTNPVYTVNEISTGKAIDFFK